MMPIVDASGSMAEPSISSLKNWFQREAEKEAKKDVLKTSDRFGNLIGIIFGVVCLLFFVVHLTSQTGFFTPSFETVSAIIFFGVTAWGLIASSIRLVTGKRSPSKLFDIIGSILVMISVIYFLSSWQFNFSHVSDPLPDFLKWGLEWMTNEFVMNMMVLVGIVLVFVIPFQIVSYRYLRIELLKPQPVQTTMADFSQYEEAP